MQSPTRYAAAVVEVYTQRPCGHTSRRRLMRSAQTSRLRSASRHSERTSVPRTRSERASKVESPCGLSERDSYSNPAATSPAPSMTLFSRSTERPWETTVRSHSNGQTEDLYTSRCSSSRAIWAVAS